MKKFIFSFCILLGFADHAWADAFTIENISLSQNGEADLEIQISLEEGSTCSGFNFWLQLPEGVSFATYEKNDNTYITYSVGECYDEAPSITLNLSDGYLKVCCMTDNCTPINALRGTLLKLRVKVDREIYTGQRLTAQLLNGTISDEEGTPRNVSNVYFNIDIESDIVPGDANGDGIVSVADAVAVVNYLLSNGSTDGNFVFEAADIDGSGTITAADAHGIVSIILNQ